LVRKKNTSRAVVARSARIRCSHAVVCALVTHGASGARGLANLVVVRAGRASNRDVACSGAVVANRARTTRLSSVHRVSARRTLSAVETGIARTRGGAKTIGSTVVAGRAREAIVNTLTALNTTIGTNRAGHCNGATRAVVSRRARLIALRGLFGGRGVRGGGTSCAKIPSITAASRRTSTWEVAVVGGRAGQALRGALETTNRSDGASRARVLR